MRALVLALSLPIASWAQGEPAGEFDYYVLALSWSPNWCAIEGDARGSAQCRDGTGYGWILHGLWPQYEEGWPSNCRTDARNPNRTMTAAMEDIAGTAGLAWHAWNKHGRCSGLTAEQYFAASRTAYDAVSRPGVLRELDRSVTLPAHIIEEAFLEANPGLEPDMITITCKQGRIAEARLCLTQELELRRCGTDVIRDCEMGNALFAPVR